MAHAHARTNWQKNCIWPLIFTPGPVYLASPCAAVIGLQTATNNDSHQFVESYLTLIGQPFYKGRRILEIVASVAGASALATLAPLGGVQSLGSPRPGNPVEGNGLYTRLKGLSHRVVGRAVNCPLPGPPGLRSSLGGDYFHVGEQFSCTVCTQ